MKATEKNKNLKRKKQIRKIKKQVKGITLIALVVTIIVLLILAGIALNLTIGENDNKMLYLSILGSGAPFLIMAMVTAIVRPDE